MTKLWQIASGDTGRDYSNLCIEHDVMLIGPGAPGDYFEQTEQYAGINPRKVAQIRSFVHAPRPGNLVLLRNGATVVAVGLIPSDDVGGYAHRPQFDDVLGWDLHHTRRVIWSQDAVDELADLQPVFGGQRLRTFHQVREDRLCSRIPSLAAQLNERDLRPLPEVSETLDDDDLGVELFSAGLSNEAVERVLDAIERIRRLSAWYGSKKSGRRPSEMETVAHMIIPLLSGMGWSEQLMAVEWGRVDLALFRGTPTVGENCVAVIEAKRPGRGLASAYHQARGYLERDDLQSCRKAVATDGQRILIYDKGRNGRWPEEPTGYVNLGMIRRKNLFPSGVNGVETLIGLMPARIGRGGSRPDRDRASE